MGRNESFKQLKLLLILSIEKRTQTRSAFVASVKFDTLKPKIEAQDWNLWRNKSCLEEETLLIPVPEKRREIMQTPLGVISEGRGRGQNVRPLYLLNVAKVGPSRPFWSFLKGFLGVKLQN